MISYQGFLDAIRRGQEQVLGDLSMTLCDPFAINFLASAATKIMNHQVKKGFVAIFPYLVK